MFIIITAAADYYTVLSIIKTTWIQFRCSKLYFWDFSNKKITTSHNNINTIILVTFWPHHFSVITIMIIIKINIIIMTPVITYFLTPSGTFFSFLFCFLWNSNNTHHFVHPHHFYHFVHINIRHFYNWRLTTVTPSLLA